MRAGEEGLSVGRLQAKIDIAEAMARKHYAEEQARAGAIARRKDWPVEYDFRALRNALHRQWEGREAELRASPQAARADFDAGVASGDFTRANATVGEAVGLIHDLPDAGEAVLRMARDAEACLAGASRLLGI